MESDPGWEPHLASLIRAAVTSAQMRAVVMVLLTAEAKDRYVRKPRCGYDEDGKYHLTWAYSDIPSITLAVEVNKSGTLEWFFRDRETDTTEGTDACACNVLPDAFWKRYHRFLTMSDIESVRCNPMVMTPILGPIEFPRKTTVSKEQQ